MRTNSVSYEIQIKDYIGWSPFQVYSGDQALIDVAKWLEEFRKDFPNTEFRIVEIQTTTTTTVLDY